jgi:fumarate reductase subunit D
MNKIKNEGKPDFALTKENYILLIIGFVIIVIGFLLMLGGGALDPNTFNEKELFSFRRVTLAPVVILLGFIFEIYAIMKKSKNNSEVQ